MDTIVHISDIHVRPLDRHDEYRYVFEQFYDRMCELKAKKRFCIVITGDIFDAKDTLKPESIMLVRTFLCNLADIAPVIVIAGNHDMLENDKRRMDQLTPVTHLVNVHYLRLTGVYPLHGMNFIVNSRVDMGSVDPKGLINLPKPRIFLYHGFVGKETHTLETYNGLYDMMLLGDIHTRCFLQPNVAYAGSFVQQNFKEPRDGHGYIVWDIASCRGEAFDIHNKVGFVTIDAENPIYPADLEEKTKLRIKTRSCDSRKAKAIENELRKKTDIVSMKIQGVGIKNPVEQVAIDETTMIKSIAKKHGFARLIDGLLTFHAKMMDEVDQSKYDACHNWSIDKMSFRNMLSYGSNASNTIDFTELTGITCIGGQNASGKSNLLKLMLYLMFPSRCRGREAYMNISAHGYDAQCVFTSNGKTHKLTHKASVKGRGISVIQRLNLSDGAEVSSVAEVTECMRENVGSDKAFKTKNVQSNSMCSLPVLAEGCAMFDTFSTILGLDIYAGLLTNALSTKKQIEKFIIETDKQLCRLPEEVDEVALLRKMEATESEHAKVLESATKLTDLLHEKKTELKEHLTAFDRTIPALTAPEKEALGNRKCPFNDPREQRSQLRARLMEATLHLQEMKDVQECTADIANILDEIDHLKADEKKHTEERQVLGQLMHSLREKINEVDRLHGTFGMHFDPAEFKRLERYADVEPIDVTSIKTERSFLSTMFGKSKRSGIILNGIAPLTSYDEYRSMKDKVQKIQRQIDGYRHDKFTPADELEDVNALEAKIEPITPVKTMVKEPFDAEIAHIQDKLTQLSASIVTKDQISAYIDVMQSLPSIDTPNGKGYIMPERTRESMLTLLQKMQTEDFADRCIQSSKLSTQLAQWMHKKEAFQANEDARARNEQIRASNYAITRRIGNVKMRALFDEYDTCQKQINAYVDSQLDRLTELDQLLDLQQKHWDYVRQLNLKGKAYAESELTECMKTLSANASAENERTKRIHELGLIIKHMEQWQRKEKLMSEHEELTEAVKDVEMFAKQENDRYRLKIDPLEKEIATMEDKLSIDKARLIEMQRDYDDAKATFDRAVKSKKKRMELTDTMNKLQASLEMVDAYTFIMNGARLPSALLTHRLNAVTNTANTILAKLVNFTLVLETGYCSNSKRRKMEYTIKKNGVELDIGQLSGYETFATSIALKIALNIHSMHGRADIFWIDEGLDCIDASNFERLGPLFDIMRQEFRNVMVISHLENVQRFADNVVTVMHDGESSYLDI